MPTVLEHKMLRFHKERQKAAEVRSKPRKAIVQGICKKCRAKVTFLTNAFGSVRLIFCPNCKHINAQETITKAEQTAQEETQTKQQPTVVITGPR